MEAKSGSKSGKVSSSTSLDGYAKRLHAHRFCFCHPKNKPQLPVEYDGSLCFGYKVLKNLGARDVNKLEDALLWKTVMDKIYEDKTVGISKKLLLKKRSSLRMKVRLNPEIKALLVELLESSRG